MHLRRGARVRRPARGERDEQDGPQPHPLSPSPHRGEGGRRPDAWFPLSTLWRGGQGVRPHEETRSVARGEGVRGGGLTRRPGPWLVEGGSGGEVSRRD